MNLPKAIIKSLRPKQWAKNVLLLSGLYFPEVVSGQPLITYPSEIMRALAAFVVFCGLSGAVYLLNDLVDAPKDRLHPTKKNRPIAAGHLSPTLAGVLTVLIAGLVLCGAYFLSLSFFLCAVAYFTMMIAYSFVLKHVFLIDTMIISMGFIIRAVSGVIVLRTEDQLVELTPWFVICVLFLSLLVAFCKRRAELIRLQAGAANVRRVLAYYSPMVLDIGIGVCSTGAILAYALYSTQHPKPWDMLTTMPFVIFGIFRYLDLVYVHGLGDAPEEALLTDKSLLSCVVLWGFALLLVFYPGG